ncbi:hypothetical protein MMC10_008667 [Thelotrema lepadinum]|nr:hypothetical protein [Thelotrema lepadinum]
MRKFLLSKKPKTRTTHFVEVSTGYFPESKKHSRHDASGSDYGHESASDTDYYLGSDAKDFPDSKIDGLSRKEAEAEEFFENGGVHVIDLKVGERHFEADAYVLRKAPWFRKVLNPSHVQRGVRIPDTDGDMFAHILRYLRHPVLPQIAVSGSPDSSDFLVMWELAEHLGTTELAEFMKQRSEKYNTVSSAAPSS